MVLWFTGLSGAGKSTIAQLVVDGLRADGQHAVLLDGDELRRGLTKDLGFSDADRAESVRRAAEVARLMTDAGLLVAVALISPFRRDRALARGLFAAGQFLEIFVDTSLEVAEARDVKGLYRRARLGLLPAFTGIDSPYEPPLAPDIHIATALVPAHEAAALIVAAVPARPAGVFAGHQPKSGHE